MGSEDKEQRLGLDMSLADELNQARQEIDRLAETNRRLHEEWKSRGEEIERLRTDVAYWRKEHDLLRDLYLARDETDTEGGE